MVYRRFDTMHALNSAARACGPAAGCTLQIGCSSCRKAVAGYRLPAFCHLFASVILVFVAFFALDVDLGVAKVHEVRKRRNAAHAPAMKKVPN